MTCSITKREFDKWFCVIDLFVEGLRKILKLALFSYSNLKPELIVSSSLNPENKQKF